MFNKNPHTVITVFLSAGVWLGERWFSEKFEGQAHYTLFPNNGSEFSALVLMIAAFVLLGMFVDTRKHITLQQYSAKEVHRIYTAMVYAMHHILNNFLNGMELVRMEAMKCHDFDPHILRLYDEASKMAAEQIRALSHLEEVSESKIMAHVAPGIRPMP